MHISIYVYIERERKERDIDTWSVRARAGAFVVGHADHVGRVPLQDGVEGALLMLYNMIIYNMMLYDILVDYVTLSYHISYYPSCWGSRGLASGRRRLGTPKTSRTPGGGARRGKPEGEQDKGPLYIYIYIHIYREREIDR